MGHIHADWACMRIVIVYPGFTLTLTIPVCRAPSRLQ